MGYRRTFRLEGEKRRVSQKSCYEKVYEGGRIKLGRREDIEKKVGYLLANVGQEIKINDPITGGIKKFIFEGFEEGGNERGEPLMVVRYPNSRIFKQYHIDYLLLEEEEKK